LAYANWLSEFEKSTSGAEQAQCWNLKNEPRIDAPLNSFKEGIGKRFEDEIKNGNVGLKAACDAIKQAMVELTEPHCSQLGLLPFVRPDSFKEILISHLPARDLLRYAPTGPFDEDNPPATIHFTSPFKSPYNFPRARFIWLTFPTPDMSMTDDPTLIVKELGLAHIVNGGFLFRFELSVKGMNLFVPTCLDAALYEAWAPPPSGSPWGMTRHLETGHHCRPEVLTNSMDHSSVRPVATLVSPPGSRVRIGSATIDFMIGRA